MFRKFIAYMLVIAIVLFNFLPIVSITKAKEDGDKWTVTFNSNGGTLVNPIENIDSSTTIDEPITSNSNRVI